MLGEVLLLVLVSCVLVLRKRQSEKPKNKKNKKKLLLCTEVSVSYTMYQERLPVVHDRKYEHAHMHAQRAQCRRDRVKEGLGIYLRNRSRRLRPADP